MQGSLQAKIVISSMGSAVEKQIDTRQIHPEGKEKERDGGGVGIGEKWKVTSCFLASLIDIFLSCHHLLDD